MQAIADCARGATSWSLRRDGVDVWTVERTPSLQQGLAGGDVNSMYASCLEGAIAELVHRGIAVVNFDDLQKAKTAEDNVALAMKISDKLTPAKRVEVAQRTVRNVKHIMANQDWPRILASFRAGMEQTIVGQTIRFL